MYLGTMLPPGGRNWQLISPHCSYSIHSERWRSYAKTCNQKPSAGIHQTFYKHLKINLSGAPNRKMTTLFKGNVL
jgi:hypothetical protein